MAAKADKKKSEADATQQRALKGWMNGVLAPHKIRIHNFDEDFADGVLLVDFLAILEASQRNEAPLIGRRKSSTNRMRRLDNASFLFSEFRRLSVPITNIGPEDIVDNGLNVKLLMALIYRLFLKFSISSKTQGGEEDAKGALLLWCQAAISPHSLRIDNFTSSFQDGRALLAVVDFILPGKFESSFILTGEKEKILNAVFSTAESQLGVPRAFETEDFDEKPDEVSIIMYLVMLRNAAESRQCNPILQSPEVRISSPPPAEIAPKHQQKFEPSPSPPPPEPISSGHEQREISEIPSEPETKEEFLPTFASVVSRFSEISLPSLPSFSFPSFGGGNHNVEVSEEETEEERELKRELQIEREKILERERQRQRAEEAERREKEQKEMAERQRLAEDAELEAEINKLAREKREREEKERALQEQRRAIEAQVVRMAAAAQAAEQEMERDDNAERERKELDRIAEEKLKKQNETDVIRRRSSVGVRPPPPGQALSQAELDDLLNIAARDGDTENVSNYIKKGASVNSTNFLGFTPLHIASIRAHLEVVRLLLEAKAQVNDEYGSTPLHLAAQHGHMKLVEMLIFEFEMNPDQKNKYGESALDRAGGDPRLVEIIKGSKGHWSLKK